MNWAHVLEYQNNLNNAIVPVRPLEISTCTLSKMVICCSDKLDYKVLPEPAIHLRHRSQCQAMDVNARSGVLQGQTANPNPQTNTKFYKKISLHQYKLCTDHLDSFYIIKLCNINNCWKKFKLNQDHIDLSSLTFFECNLHDDAVFWTGTEASAVISFLTLWGGGSSSWTAMESRGLAGS